MVIAMAVIHEAGHFLVASAVGIPFKGIRIGISNWNPVIILPRISFGHFSNMVPIV